jgi:hypothetical protein
MWQANQFDSPKTNYIFSYISLHTYYMKKVLKLLLYEKLLNILNKIV